jgi:Limonene-1,2-epoxide hydrolase
MPASWCSISAKTAYITHAGLAGLRSCKSQGIYQCISEGLDLHRVDVLNLMSKGDIIVAERLDRTMVGDKAVNLPCCGVFEMENGKIKVWRDYFDMATYLNPADRKNRGHRISV